MYLKKRCALFYEGRVNMNKDHVNIYIEYLNNAISDGFWKVNQSPHCLQEALHHIWLCTYYLLLHLSLYLEFYLQVSPSDTSNFEDNPGPPMESYPMLTEEEEAMFQDL